MKDSGVKSGIQHLFGTEWSDICTSKQKLPNENTFEIQKFKQNVYFL